MEAQLLCLFFERDGILLCSEVDLLGSSLGTPVELLMGESGLRVGRGRELPRQDSAADVF